jgi:hypothetical protein
MTDLQFVSEMSHELVADCPAFAFLCAIGLASLPDAHSPAGD